MAYAAIISHRYGTSACAVMKRPFAALFRGLIRLADADPRMLAVRRLNGLSDGDLAARGTSRISEVNRIFGPSMYL